MKMLSKFGFGVAFSLAMVAGGDVALAGQQSTDQVAALQSRRQGALSPPEIERRVVPQMRGWDYLGFDFDPYANIYTLKFLRNGTVVWVEVDARTGQVLRRTGN